MKESLKEEACRWALGGLSKADEVGEVVTQSHLAPLPGESTQATSTMAQTEAPPQAMDVYRVAYVIPKTRPITGITLT